MSPAKVSQYEVPEPKEGKPLNTELLNILAATALLLMAASATTHIVSAVRSDRREARFFENLEREQAKLNHPAFQQRPFDYDEDEYDDDPFDYDEEDFMARLANAVAAGETELYMPMDDGSLGIFQLDSRNLELDDEDADAYGVKVTFKGRVA